MKTYLEVQQREDIRRDLAEGMKFVPPELRVGEPVFYWQEDPGKIQHGRESGKRLKVEIIAVKGLMVDINTGTSIFQVNASKQRRPLDTVDLEEPPDSCEGTGAPDVLELFSDNTYLSAILDRQRLMVAAPLDLRTKKAESFSPQALQGFWSKMNIKNPKIVEMPPTVFTKYTNQKEVIWQQYRLCLAVAEYQILGANISWF